MLSDHARGLLSAVSTHLRMAAECVSAVAEGRPVTVDPSVLAPIEEGEHEAPTDAPAGVVEAAPPGLRQPTAKVLREIDWHGDYRTDDDHTVLRDVRVGALRAVQRALDAAPVAAPPVETIGAPSTTEHKFCGRDGTCAVCGRRWHEHPDELNAIARALAALDRTGGEAPR